MAGSGEGSGERRSLAASQLQGTLTQLQGDIVVPSTLTYKERTELRRKDAYEYGRIYNTPGLQGMTVFDRLTKDASVRQTLTTMARAAQPPADHSSFAAMERTAALAAATAKVAGMDKPYHPTESEVRKSQTISGWTSNNNVNLTCKQLQADTASTAEPALSALHPITLHSYYKKHPVDFLAAARPQARTMSETTLMMGAYSSDVAVAEALGVHVPNACSSAKLMMQ